MARPRSDLTDLSDLAAKPRWTPDDARLVLDTFARSNETSAEFCARHGIHPARLARRLREREPQPAEVPTVRFAEIALRSAVDPEGVALRIDLEPGAVRVLVMVPDRCPPSWLAEVAAGLRSVRA